MTKVHEVAVRVVKPGSDTLFTRRRAAFVAKLKSQKGVLADCEFESFFALPALDERPVFVGMTTYDQLSTVNWIQMNPLVMLKFLPFFTTMSLKAYAFCEQTEGPELDLDTLGALDDRVVHIAVRRVSADQLEAHDSARKAFYELLMARDGVGPHYELKAVKGFSIQGMTVAITEFANDEAMGSAFEALSEHEVFAAYTATFETVASQFTHPTTNE
ncbi:MAG: hypothetical protein AAF602_24710 [Myxococcota bacterium]